MTQQEQQKALDNLKAAIGKVVTQTEEFLSDLQDAVDFMTETQRDSERGEQIQSLIGQLEEVQSSLESAQSDADDIQ